MVTDKTGRERSFTPGVLFMSRLPKQQIVAEIEIAGPSKRLGSRLRAGADDGRRNPVGVTKRSTVSTASLKTFLPLHVRPINPVVFRGSQAMLISRWASRLDAFSGYPCRT